LGGAKLSHAPEVPKSAVLAMRIARLRCGDGDDTMDKG
jgi:hypothetical protein